MLLCAALVLRSSLSGLCAAAALRCGGAVVALRSCGRVLSAASGAWRGGGICCAGGVRTCSFGVLVTGAQHDVYPHAFPQCAAGGHALRHDFAHSLQADTHAGALQHIERIAQTHSVDIGHYPAPRRNGGEGDAIGVCARLAPSVAVYALSRVGHLQFAEHIAGCAHVTVQDVRLMAVECVAGGVEVVLSVARHDALGYSAEHGAALAAARGRRCLLDAHDAGVLRVIGGEVAHEGHEVARRAAVLGPYLRRAGLSRHLEVGRTGLAARSLAHHEVQTALYIAQRLGGAHSLPHDAGRILRYEFSATLLGYHKARVHHAAAVGYAVVEG